MYASLLHSCALLIKQGCAKQFYHTIDIDDIKLDVPPDEKLGDVSFACFALAKSLHMPPQEIARLLKEAIQKNHSKKSCVHYVTQEGPYVNFTFNPAILASNLFSFSFKKGGKQHKKEKIVLEFISPNTNKPLHLGHIRNAFLGESVARLNEALGKNVIRTNLTNDRGIHICKSMIAYMHENAKINPPTPKNTGKKGDHFVGDYYVAFEKLLKENPDVIKEAILCLQQWEAGEKKIRSLWKKMNGWVLKGLQQTYKRLGISFDRFYFESELYLKGKELIKKGLQKGVFIHDESGAILAPLEKYNLPNKVVLRKDGTSLYVTQDMFLAQQKMNDFSANQSITVVASEQDLYFKQLFKILELLGFGWAKKCYHLSYGMVRLPEGKMKSREGTTVDADTLLDELEHLAAVEIKKRDEKISVSEIHKRKIALAHAALGYYLLEVHPKSDMVFKAQESISFTGKTGPYLLYTYARFKNILRKAGKINQHALPKEYDWVNEKKLILLLAQFLTQIERAVEDRNPSIFAHYLYALAKTATEYYHTTSVLQAPSPVKNARCMLIAHFIHHFSLGLSFLTLSPLEKM